MIKSLISQSTVDGFSYFLKLFEFRCLLPGVLEEKRKTKMFDFKVLNVLFALSVALFVSSAAAEFEFEYAVPVESENVELIREKREAEPRRGHLLNLLGNKYQYTESYRPTQEYHHSGGSGNTATFAQSSAGAISANNGHGHGSNLGSQSSSQSASYSFGPFSASFSASQSNANGGGFFDY